METVDYSVYEEQIRRLVGKQVIGKEVRELKEAIWCTSWERKKTRRVERGENPKRNGHHSYSSEADH